MYPHKGLLHFTKFYWSASVTLFCFKTIVERTLTTNTKGSLHLEKKCVWKFTHSFLYPLRSMFCDLEILFWHRNELKLLKTQNFIYFLIFYFETFPNNTMFSKHRLTSLCFMKWKHFRKIKNSSNFTLTMSLKYRVSGN